MKSVSILGATGSIGKSTLDLVQRQPDAFKVEALTAQSNVAELAAAAIAVGAQQAVIGDERLYAELKDALSGTCIGVAAGRDALIAAAASGADWTMAAIVGCAGLEPVMAAIEQGGTVALANKEALVSAGDVLMLAVAEKGTALLPVDSEHNAIFQCFEDRNAAYVRRVILTASGGPFRTMAATDLVNVTPAQAVRHPNWSMGAKISVDSATLMNKGLELIEAYHLFPVNADQLDVIVHPQSVIHSMVEYQDGSVLAQLGSPDMRTPIAHCLAFPDRMHAPVARLNFAQIGQLGFEDPDMDRFPCLRLAKNALAAGGARPAILNAANEIAVAGFLGGQIGFMSIPAVVESVLEQYDAPAPSTIRDVLDIDEEARRLAGLKMEAVAA
ncbi:MAG: 1-deoxy-D-xylulose-5-phosphate reductoisomerase [Sphingomonadaceae bacterium]|nr:1-deoxy-D-xylulose-5-phosphate reductoisomerase [Sphingomonadaceae bacterium]